MSWLSDLATLFDGGSRSTAVATTQNTTSVTVNPTILNAVDFSALAQPMQRLVDSLAGVARAEADAGPALAASIKDAGSAIGTAISATAKAQTDNQEQLKQLATWVSLAGIAFAVIRMVRA